MKKSEALALAIYNWGPNAYAVRARELQRNLRFRVGYAALDPEGQPMLFVLGMGHDWSEAFKSAENNPKSKPQQEKIAALRNEFRQKVEEQSNNQQESAK